MTNLNHINSIASEFKWDSEKLIKKLSEGWIPSFSPSSDFKQKLDHKLSERIEWKKQQIKDIAAIRAVPKKLRRRFYLTWYWYAICSFLVLFLIWFCTNIFTGTIKVPTKYTYLPDKQAFWEMIEWTSSIELYEDWYFINEQSFIDRSINTAFPTITATNLQNNLWDIYLNDQFHYDQTYRFAYKSKLFPKLSEEYPVFKVSGTLISYSTPNQIFKNLKVWEIPLKNFSDLEMIRFEMNQNIENWYSIIFDKETQKLHFSPNETRESSDFSWSIPSNKQILKSVEKNLKLLWISLKNYWKWIIDSDDFDDNMWIVQIFYPLQLDWKNVWDPEQLQQIWIRIAYDLNLDKIVYINDIDIAKYEVSNYSTLEKWQIEDKISQWWSYFLQWALHENSVVILFDSMEIVYIEKKLDNWDIFYVPAIKWNISTSIENYSGPDIIFQEII